ncbi:AsnC family protein [Deinococcus petrolearius]|uniref:AsnC family protein n=1 Tax=Deinococcus petrolearius TaxID=1751295 RepID=A0ABW1DQS7_9DEIO
MSLPGDVPRWPAALRDETPLPYAVWRVMDHVDGRRSVADIGRALGLSAHTVAQALAQANEWTQRASQRSQALTPALRESVEQCLLSVVGPIGEVVVDDALQDVGESPSLEGLLSAIAEQLSEAQLHAFVRQLRARNLT